MNNPYELRPGITAGRYLRCLAVAKGDRHAAAAYCESQGRSWLDRGTIISALKSGVSAIGTSDFAGANVPIGNDFLAVLRGFSVPLRLQNLKLVPLLTRIFTNSSGAIGYKMAEGDSVPVCKGNWAARTFSPIIHAGISITTSELAKSSDPVATAALTDDLASAIADAENYSFCSPDISGSVLNGQTNFTASGESLANIDSDLTKLIGCLGGAYRPGAAFLMCQETATFLSLMRGTGGARAYPDISPQGGMLQGLPVLVTDAMIESGSPTNHFVGLVNPGEVFYADGGIELTASIEATLEMLDDPTNDSITPTATNLISLFQTDAVALKGYRRSSWYARAGAGAYYVCGY